MGRRGWGLAAAVCALVAAGGTAQAAPLKTVELTGSGGQAAVLDVGRGGLTIGYLYFGQPRLPGGDGAVGGVAVQRVSTGGLAGGVLLQNAPGFDGAIDIPLVDFERTRLVAGRYRFTLLGSGRQSVRLQVLTGHAPRHLVARGPARPITRTIAKTSATLDSWSDSLGRIRASDYVIVGAGSGGDEQQADAAALCVQPQSAPLGDPCVGGEGFGISPGAGGSAAWSASLYAPGDLEPGSYLFTGHAIGVGPSSVCGHAAVVVSLRR